MEFSFILIHLGFNYDGNLYCAFTGHLKAKLGKLPFLTPNEHQLTPFKVNITAIID